MKTLGVVLLSFLLFILLTVFSLAFSVNQIALSPSFATGILNDIDFSQTVRDALEYQQTRYTDEDLSPELVDAIVDALDGIEPVIKENSNIAIRDTYDYLLGKANAPNLQEILGDSFMNSQFIDSLLDNIDISRIVDEVMKEQTTSTGIAEDALQESLPTALKKLEPTIKRGLVVASDPVFKYLLGETQTINLKTVLRQNILNKALITEMVNALDINSIAKDMLGDQLDMTLPQGITLNSSETDQLIAVAEPAIKTGLISAADPIADYLLGIRPSFNLTVTWNPVSPTTKAIIKQAFLRQLPSSLANATQAQKDQAYEIYWASAQSSIPTSFDIDSTMLGEDLSLSIDNALTSAQNGLADARNGINDAAIQLEDNLGIVRPYIRMFQLAYWGLILLILLVIGGIILINRSIKGATRNLGINFLVYGGINLIGVLILKTTIGNPQFIQRFITGEIPDFALNVLSPIIQRLTQPLFMFTLACTIIGIVLLVVSLYLNKKTDAVTNQPLPPSA